jgi:hypothetical protein
MTNAPFPPEAILHMQVQFTEHGYERAMLKSLLARAQVTGDATFRIFRQAHLTVRFDPESLIDALAMRCEWQSLRPDSSTVIVRAEGLFGIVEASGSREKCFLSVQLWTDTPQRGDSWMARILADYLSYEFTDIGFSLNWRFLDGKGQIARATTEERASGELLDEAYPLLAGVEGFIEEYLEAPETVLVLQGAPGTGKTRLIRAILGAISRRSGETADVLYTGDSAVLESDEVFLEFITQSHRAFVVEDADHLLKPRSGGNQILHRFLNIADGIAAANGKKIVFSTNLPNMNDIDEALVRPGRCFAHLYLEALQGSEAAALLKRLCVETPERENAAMALLNLQNRKSVSVAEVYAAHRNAGPQRARPPALRVGGGRGSQRMAVGFN